MMGFYLDLMVLNILKNCPGNSVSLLLSQLLQNKMSVILDFAHGFMLYIIWSDRRA